MSPEKCPICDLSAQKVDGSTSSRILGGFKLNGIHYHPYDTVLISSNFGPCKLGQITSIAEVTSGREVDPFMITVRIFKPAIDFMDGMDSVDANQVFSSLCSMFAVSSD